MRPEGKSDNYLLAKRYFQRNRDTSPFDLARLFEMSLRQAYRVIEDVTKYQDNKKYPWDTIELEIKGMDWEYNPEREIRNLQVPKY